VTLQKVITALSLPPQSRAGHYQRPQNLPGPIQVMTSSFSKGGRHFDFRLEPGFELHEQSVRCPVLLFQRSVCDICPHRWE
jgi:hypothetical protein